MTAHRQRWLILSHAFNMDGRAASLTVTDKLRYLAQAGIEPVILSAITGEQDKRYEHHRLLPWGPAALRFDLRHLLARHLGRGIAYRVLMLLISLVLAPFMVLEKLLIGLRNQWSWALPAFVRGAWMLRRGDIDLVYSSGGAYSAHLAGWWLKRWCGAKWIVEVHDPMVFPGREPANRDERFQAKLEGLICQHADLAWWFTEGALAAAQARHPVLRERGIVVMPGAEPPLRPASYTPGPVCVLGHFGSLSDSRSLVPFIRALNHLLAHEPEWRPLLRLEVYGGAIDGPAQKLIEQHKLDDVVIPMGRLEHDPATGLSGRERVVQRMQQVDALLLMHGEGDECEQYIPSKLYDYFWARRPVLAYTHLNPQLDRLVREHQGWCAPATNTVAGAAALRELILRWQAGQLTTVTVPPVSTADAVDEILSVVEVAKISGISKL